MDAALLGLIGGLGGTVLGGSMALAGQELQWRRQRREKWGDLQRHKCGEIIAALNSVVTSNDHEEIGSGVADLFDLHTELMLIAPLRVQEITFEPILMAAKHQEGLQGATAEEARKSQSELQQSILDCAGRLRTYFGVREGAGAGRQHQSALGPGVPDTPPVSSSAPGRRRTGEASLASSVTPDEVVSNEDALYDRLEGLYLAGGDMHGALMTARYLQGIHPDALGHVDGVPAEARRAIETGMFVTYARPFMNQARGRLKLPPGLSEELRATHNKILDRRNTVYAHTDRTQLRRIIELGDPSSRERQLTEAWETCLHEEWEEMTVRGLEDVVDLTA